MAGTFTIPHGPIASIARCVVCASPAITRFVTVSQRAANGGCERPVGIPQRRIRQICNGVDTRQFQCGTWRARRRCCCRRSPFPRTPVVVVSVRPPQPGQGSVDARARLHRRSQAIRTGASVAPRCMVGDGPLRARAAGVLAAARLADLAWLPGSRDDVAACCAATRCLRAAVAERGNLQHRPRGHGERSAGDRHTRRRQWRAGAHGRQDRLPGTRRRYAGAGRGAAADMRASPPCSPQHGQAARTTPGWSDFSLGCAMDYEAIYKHALAQLLGRPQLMHVRHHRNRSTRAAGREHRSRAAAADERVAAPPRPRRRGVHHEPGVGLGHRRLSIIDLATGQQPLYNEDGIGRRRLQRRDLQLPGADPRAARRSGHVFRTRSDTEVIVHAWEAWGEDCVERFRGMFAFALWDAQPARRCSSRATASASSRCTTRCCRTACSLFGSELKSLLAHRRARARHRSAARSRSTSRSATCPSRARSSPAARKLPPGAHADAPARRSRCRQPREYWDVRVHAAISTIAAADAQRRADRAPARERCACA